MDVFCGIDWAEDHHDIALVDRDGKLLARRRISDDTAGLGQLLTLLAEHGDSAGDLIPVAIETPRGPLVACLRATSWQIYPVNPMAVARYRDRHSVAGRKSDHGDAVVLANVLRTDLHAHRPLPADSELAQASAVLARAQQMHQPPLVEQAMGRQTLALLRQLDAACASADDLEQAAVQSFNQHPDAGIITSFPGLGPLTGARVLAEIGDDRSRFQDAKGLKPYAGAAPITRASGKTRSVTHRRVKNNRLNAAGYTWAFSALTASPGARAHYDRRRDTGDGHAAAQRNLFGRLLGCLHKCLTTGQHYDEDIAFPDTTKQSHRAA
jgi:Transposase/Transposase IS116/IS110/IS902 family